MKNRGNKNRKKPQGAGTSQKQRTEYQQTRDAAASSTKSAKRARRRKQ